MLLIIIFSCFYLTSNSFASEPLFQARIDYQVGDGPNSVYSCDLDGDSDADLSAANYNSDCISILLNNGDGTFQSAVNYGTGESPWSVYACDLDGDGDADLAVVNFYSDNVSILFNTTTLTGIRKFKSHPISTSFVLNQNYSNPFNPVTQITYTIPQNSRVNIELYDLMDKKVKVLLNERKPAGYYTLAFNVGDLASGVYFYRRQAGNFVSTKKMLLIK